MPIAAALLVEGLRGVPSTVALQVEGLLDLAGAVALLAEGPAACRVRWRC